VRATIARLLAITFIESPLSTQIPSGAGTFVEVEGGKLWTERVIVKETGHLLYLEKPTEFARLVTTFLQRHGNRSAP
jgi:hypothetical protein